MGNPVKINLMDNRQSFQKNIDLCICDESTWYTRKNTIKSYSFWKAIRLVWKVGDAYKSQNQATSLNTCPLNFKPTPSFYGPLGHHH